MAQRVTGKEIEITVGVCWVSVRHPHEFLCRVYLLRCLETTNNKKPGPLVVDKGKWVVNVSQRTLGPAENTALEKGLNFSITPKKIPVAKILSSVENGILSLNQLAKDTIRVSVSNILKNCKVPATVKIAKEQ